MGPVPVHQGVELAAPQPAADKQDRDGEAHKGEDRIDEEGRADAVGESRNIAAERAAAPAEAIASAPNRS